MKKITAILSSFLLIVLFFHTVFPCGPGYITPIFEYEHAPENPNENFAAGRLGILKPTYRRVVLFAAYRYLSGGGFSAEEQKSLVQVWDAEFNKKNFETDQTGEAVQQWVKKRKEVVGDEEKLPEIYVERDYGGYDFFPNCTQNAFETAVQTLSDRITNYGAENKDVKEWVKTQDQVFGNCAVGRQIPDPPNPSMPQWLQKDRAYQIAAAEFYSLNYEKAKQAFKEISEDADSPWQETSGYLVARTLIREASLTKDAARSNQFYSEAEEHLQNISAGSGKFHDSAERLMGLIAYRLRPKERVQELARNLSLPIYNTNFRQDLVDYNWLLDKFEKEVLETEEKRKSEEAKQNENTNFNTNSSASTDTVNNTQLANTNQTEGLLTINLYNEDYSQFWTIKIKPDATDEEALAEAEKIVGRPLSETMKQTVRNQRKLGYVENFSRNRQSDYQGGYYGSETMSLSILPDFLRVDELNDWLFTYQIKNNEAYLYSLNKFRQTSSDLWLMTALSKANKDSAELKNLLEAANRTNHQAPAYPTIAYHQARILIEKGKNSEAKKLLDDILSSSADNLPISSKNQFLALRLKIAETLDDFLKDAQRKPFAFDFDGFTGSVDDFIKEQKTWYDPKYSEKSQAEWDAEIEENYKEERKWQDRLMIDDHTMEIINEHFPMSVLLQAEKSPSLPDYLRQRFADTIWTRAVLLNDFEMARKISPEILKFHPEMKPLIDQINLAKTPVEQNRAALFAIIKNDKFTPYIPSGFGTPQESYKSYADNWWCIPYDSDEEETGGGNSASTSEKPSFLTTVQSNQAQAELKKLKEIGDAPKFLGEKVLEWARIAPLDKRLPESLYVVWEGNGWTKYGCGGNEELREKIGNLLKRKFPNSEWTRKMQEDDPQ